MRVEPFSLDLAAPLSTASGVIERREGFTVHVEVDGAAGVGEATPLGPWTETLDSCREALANVADDDPETAREAVGRTGAPAAAHAVDLAVQDARARARGVPLWAVLAEEARVSAAAPDTVPVNATVGDALATATAEAAADAVARGFEAIKVKVGARPLAEDVDRLRAVREAVGPTVELRADANGAYRSVEEARTALGAFVEVGVRYVEQPLPAPDLDDHADLRGGDVGVALDESLAVASPGEILDAGAADVLVLKPMALGGPSRAAAVAHRALDAGVTPVVTTTIDAVYARTAALHVAATLPDPPACGLATADMLVEDLAEDPAPVEDGRMRVPAGPGTLGGGA